MTKKRGHPRSLAWYIRLGQSSDSAMIKAFGCKELNGLATRGGRSKGRRKDVASGRCERAFSSPVWVVAERKRGSKGALALILLAKGIRRFTSPREAP